MGHTGGGVLAVADMADDRALRDHAAGRDDGRVELEQRDRIAVGSHDRDRAAAARHRAGEGDGSCGRGAHRRADNLTDVDAAVLAGGVAVLGQGERSQDRPVGRPGPSGRDRDDDQGRDRRSDRDGEHAPHRVPPSGRGGAIASTLAGRFSGFSTIPHRECYGKLARAGRPRRPPDAGARPPQRARRPPPPPRSRRRLGGAARSPRARA